ncbi:hypothetical protein Bca101_059040 [Brassica carinata]
MAKLSQRLSLARKWSTLILTNLLQWISLISDELRLRGEEGLGKRGDQWTTEVLSWEPRAFVYQSKEECEYLISLAKPHMVKSTVVDSQTGKSKESRFGCVQAQGLSLGEEGTKSLETTEKKNCRLHGDGIYVTSPVPAAFPGRGRHGDVSETFQRRRERHG